MRFRKLLYVHKYDKIILVHLKLLCLTQETIKSTGALHKKVEEHRSTTFSLH